MEDVQDSGKYLNLTIGIDLRLYLTKPNIRPLTSVSVSRIFDRLVVNNYAISSSQRLLYSSIAF